MVTNNLNLSAYERGMSIVEVLIVVALIAVLALAFFPNIRSTMETRDFENAARDIQTTIQRARMEAVKTKLNHRVRFVEETSGWEFLIEKEDSPGNWSLLPGFVKKIIPSRFNVTVSLPDQIIVFSPLGFIQNFSSSQSSVTIQSPKLDSAQQPDQRTITIFAGGSTRYISSESG
jgi:prepilin-type N-terminal cleavage/methylation domain-containing protein